MRAEAALLALAGATGQTLEEAARIPLPPDLKVSLAVVSPDGRQLTAACSDRKLHVWA